MSQTKAHPETHHADPADQKALVELDKHILGTEKAADDNSAIPVPEEGGHAKSHAAHLDVPGDTHTKPAGTLHQGATPGELREPPQEVSRVGKGHRRE